MSLLIVGSLATDLKITTTVLIAVALLLTVYRVALRVCTRMFWWDDVCAGVALTCTIICLATDWIRLLEGGDPSIIAFWIYALASPCVVWSVRLSILAFASRVVYPSQVSRGAMLSAAPLFVLLWASLEGVSAYRYGSNRTWYTNTSSSINTEATLTRPMAVYELITDVISGSILIFLPRYWFGRVKLSHRKRRLMLATSYSSAIITSVSLIRAVFQVIPVSSLVSTATDFDIAFSLFVCNLLVILDRHFCFINRSADAVDPDDLGNDSGDSSRTTQNSLPLTSVELESLRTRASDANSDTCAVTSACALENDEAEPDGLTNTVSLENVGK